jgi:hypothetical protein
MAKPFAGTVITQYQNKSPIRLFKTVFLGMAHSIAV